jgi:hypothetical protein
VPVRAGAITLSEAMNTHRHGGDRRKMEALIVLLAIAFGILGSSLILIAIWSLREE